MLVKKDYRLGGSHRESSLKATFLVVEIPFLTSNFTASSLPVNHFPSNVNRHMYFLLELDSDNQMMQVALYFLQKSIPFEKSHFLFVTTPSNTKTTPIVVLLFEVFEGTLDSILHGLEHTNVFVDRLGHALEQHIFDFCHFSCIIFHTWL
jgi:hypothetical protein